MPKSAEFNIQSQGHMSPNIILEFHQAPLINYYYNFRPCMDTADFSSDRRTCFLKSSNHQLYFSSFGSERRVSISKIVTENHIVPVRGTDMKKSASSMSVVVFSSGGAAAGRKRDTGCFVFWCARAFGAPPRRIYRRTLSTRGIHAERRYRRSHLLA